MKNKKLIIIGIDGATFDIILPMVEKGELPTFGKLMNEGAWAELMSTYPPHTVPAWISCVTGMNPGKLGLFDFRGNSHQTYDEGNILFSTDIKEKTLWTLLSEKNKKVIVVAIPLTYPPEKVNGIMVSPVRMIDPHKVKTHPPEISAELHKELDLASTLKERKDFMEMHTSRVGSDLENFLDTTVASCKKIIDKLTEAILYLTGNYDYDFGMFMLPIDALQHHLWCFLDKKHPSYHSEIAHKYNNIIFQGYKWVDRALEEILDQTEDDATVILVSDHGFGPLHKMFYLNRWLLEKGLLKLKRGSKHSLILTTITFSRILEKIGCGFASSLLPRTIANLRLPIPKRKLKSIPALIDWKQTKAYSTSYALSINLKGREPQGIVEPGQEYDTLVQHLKKELSNLRDADNGKYVVERVMERSDLYSGPYVEDAPDIIIFFRDPKYSIRKDPLYPDLFRQLTPDDRMTGHHTSFPEGICILKGPHVIPGAQLQEPQIIDIAPTVLYLMGEQIPESMEGRVMVEAVNLDYREANPVVTSTDLDEWAEDPTIEPETISDEDDEAIKQRLRDLGYMG